MITDNVKPIQIKLDVIFWANCKDNNGNRYAQLTIEDTPDVLYKIIPIKSRPYIKGKTRLKDFSFMFKGKKFVIQFLNDIKPTPPLPPAGLL